MKTKLRSTAATVICVVALFFVQPAPAQSFFDNFNDLNDTTPAWTHLPALLMSGGQTWSAATGAYRLTAPPNGINLGQGNLGFVGSMPTGVSITDGTVQSDVVSFSAPYTAGFGIGARLNNVYMALGMTGYAFFYEPIANGGAGDIKLMWLGGMNVFNSLGTANVFLNPANDYTMTLTVIGPSIVGRVYQVGGGLVGSVSATDTRYASGFAGILGIVQSPLPTLDFTMDNFSVVPEPGSSVLVGLGLAGLLAARPRRS